MQPLQPQIEPNTDILGIDDSDSCHVNTMPRKPNLARLCCLLLIGWLHMMPALASSPALWFRYQSPQGTISISGQVTANHIRYGYDELDANMHIIRRVPAYEPKSYEQAKRRQAALDARKAEDKKLLQAHVSSSRAKQQLQALLSGLNQQLLQTQTQLIGLNMQLNKDIDQAATYEHKKQPVPSVIQLRIGEERKQIQHLEESIAQFRQNINDAKVQYNQIITRLQEIERQRH